MRHTHFHDWGKHEPYGHLPPFRFWLQTSLPAIYDDSLTYLELAGRLHWYIDQIINTLKVYDDKFCELMGLYDELEEYVRCYFDRANFPDMVKDILDDMAATGHLSEILLQYIGDFTIDPKKIKGGIVPVHYTYDHTENGIEYFKRTETDEEVLTILRNGSIVLGVFKDSPSNGSFISYMKRANFVYNGTVKEFECGCVNTVYTKDFTITYDDYVRDADDFIRSVVITDHYGEDTYLEVYPVNADLPDGYVTTVKLADGSVTTPKIADQAVTHPKLADDAVWENNIKDRSVTLPKLAKPYTIFIGDDYDLTAGGWADRAAANLGLGSNEFSKRSASGAGINGATTFLSLLQGVAGELTDAQKANTGTIVIVGGYNDRDQDLTTAASTLASFINETFPNAKVYLGMAAWKCNATAGGHKYDTGYLDMPKKYMQVAGDHGWAFIDNMQYVLHDYSLLDSTGLKPNAEGCAELARAVATTVKGGTYNMHRVGRLVTITPDAAINLQPTSQNDLFPGEHTNAGTSFMQLIDNGTVYCRLDNFWCIEFKNPTNLIGHSPAGSGGRKGEFDIFTFNASEGFFEGAEFYGGKPHPCAVVDSDGNVTNALIYLSFIDNRVRANLYKVKEKQTAHSVGIEFEEFDNVKFIHWGTPPASWVYDAYMC